MAIAQTSAQLYHAMIVYLSARPTATIVSVLNKMLSSEGPTMQHKMLSSEGPTMQLLDQLAQIDRLKAWLDSFRPLPASVIRELKQRYDVRFTYQSNAIEGNTLSQSETELVLSKGITVGGKTLVEHLEVIGHKEAIDYIEALSKDEAPIGEWEIRQIHNLVMRKISPTEAGRYRQLNVKAAGNDYVYPPHYLLPSLMSEFVQWIQPVQIEIHPVLYASEAHYRFVSIHPFADGNGRVGRLLMSLLLIKAGLPIVSISNDKRTDYIDALSTAQQSKDDFTLLFSLVSKMVIASLTETLATVATAAESKTKGQPFYQELVAFLNRTEDIQKE